MSKFDNICRQCGGSCCKLKLYSVKALEKTGAKAVYYEDETNQKISDSYVQMNKVCEFLENGKCSIYETRPQTCRDFRRSQ